jgi:hypothetical protein
MTHSVAPFASLFKAATDILPCSTFFNQIEETFVEQVYADISAFAVSTQPLGKSISLLLATLSYLPYLILIEENSKCILIGYRSPSSVSLSFSFS